MKTISNKEYSGERPLFGKSNIKLSNIRIIDGESALKEGHEISAEKSYFNGKYPFWHIQDLSIDTCAFDTMARAAIWYSQKINMSNCDVVAPKMFRKCSDIRVYQTIFSDAKETFWDCKGIKIDNCSMNNADYLFLHSSNIEINKLKLNGNYAFQNASGIKIVDSIINSKDAFWEAQDVTVINSIINSEYLAWHSKNVTLINCTITGKQPMCYAENLRLVDCILADSTEFAFEYSSVFATIKSHIESVRNPLSGHIRATSIGKIIIDEHKKAPATCVIEENYFG